MEEDLLLVGGWVGVCRVEARAAGCSQVEGSGVEEGAVLEEEALRQGWAAVGKAAYLANSHLQPPQGHFHDQMDTCLLAYKSPFRHSLGIFSFEEGVGPC